MTIGTPAPSDGARESRTGDEVGTTCLVNAGVDLVCLDAPDTFWRKHRGVALGMRLQDLINQLFVFKQDKKAASVCATKFFWIAQGKLPEVFPADVVDAFVLVPLVNLQGVGF